MLGPATSVGVALGAEGSRGAEDTGAMEKEVGTEDAGI